MGFSRQEYWSGLPFTIYQGIFPTQGLNPGLPHCKQTLYHLSHQGSPWMTQWTIKKQIPDPWQIPGKHGPEGADFFLWLIETALSVLRSADLQKQTLHLLYNWARTSKLWEIVKDRGAWRAAVHGWQRVGYDLAAEQQQQIVGDIVPTGIHQRCQTLSVWGW